MVPVKTYPSWNKRSSDKEEKIDPYRRYYFICEGRNTERWYFKKLIDVRKELQIDSNIDVIFLEKTGEHENLSNPKSLIKFADSQKKEIPFDSKYDRMVVVFDADIFEKQQSNYDEILKMGNKKNILGVTNPSFELFLLLHYKNSVEEIINPNKDNIIKNDWIGSKDKVRYIEDLFRKKSGLRPKKDEDIGKLALDVRIAIEEEKKINTDITNCKGRVTSNIGSILQSMITGN